MEKLIRKESKRMLGLKLACRYSLCEKAENYGFKNILRSFCLNGSSGEIDTKVIMSFLSQLEPKKYYEQIAEKNGIRSPFDIQIIRSYWRGVPKLKGGIWHNLTTLFPISNLAISQIRPEMVDECFVHPARIVGVKKTKLVVEYSPIVVRNHELAISDRTTRKEVERIGDLNGFKKDDWIAMHFSLAVEKLEPHDTIVLLGLSHNALNRFNSIRRPSAHYM